MSDIFDEVDEILKDVDLGAEEVTGEEAASNFNEAELQDIMSEIENLEKEFESPSDEILVDSPAEEELPAAAAVVEEDLSLKRANLQDEIDRELETSLEMKNESLDIVPEEIAKEVSAEIKAEPKAADVFSIEKKIPPVVNAPVKSNSEISFEATGQMHLNLGFKIGDESAHLSIDPLKGLVITMNGVELCINQENGCKVTMENGVKFTIPLTSSDSALKKKSA